MRSPYRINRRNFVGALGMAAFAKAKPWTLEPDPAGHAHSVAHAEGRLSEQQLAVGRRDVPRGIRTAGCSGS